MIEFSGEALLALSTGERAMLAEMAAQVGAFCGIVAPDAGTLSVLRERRGLAMALDPWMRSDADAEFAHTIEIDCSALASRRQMSIEHHMQPGIGQQVGEVTAPAPG